MVEEFDGAVAFPKDAYGRRGTSALGRTVVADALRSVDEAGAFAVERETNWRSGYVPHFRRLTEAGLVSSDAASTIATEGLASLHDRMVVVDGAGHDEPVAVLQDATPRGRLDTATVDGTGEPKTSLALPVGDRQLTGDALRRQLDDWVERNVIEPSCAAAVERVQDHPEWLRLEGRTVAVLGAGAEMGPLRSLLAWGCSVAAVDLPDQRIWAPVLDLARRSAGRLSVPVSATDDTGPPTDGSGYAELAGAAGIDLVREPVEAVTWLEGVDDALVLGNYVYAHGRTNMVVSTAVDALTHRLLAARDDLALAFLATPTDVFAVPDEAVAASVAAYDARSATAKVLGRPLRTLSRGRLLQRAHLPGSSPGICDSLVPQQGPNYALAKRLQRWRATVAREAGRTVSLNVAPATRTRSVISNRLLAAAYAGAHRFGVEVFEPATSNTLMAALLVHDLHTERDFPEPWMHEADGAAHGGLWRCPYTPRSALGLAALLGVSADRT